eukprot:gene2190-1599_t
MLRKLSPNTQVFLGTSGILGFCYYTFFVMGDKNQPKQSVFDQSRPEQVQRMLDNADAKKN